MHDVEFDAYRIEGFEVSLCYPEHWQRHVESGDTHVFWGEDSGILRVTPTSFGAGFEVDAFLERTTERRPGASFRSIGRLRFLCYAEDTGSPDATRSHHYLTGRGRILIVCTWSYARSLLDDDATADHLVRDTRLAEAALASLAFD